MKSQISSIDGRVNYLLLLAASGVPLVVNFLLAPLITSHVSQIEYGRFVAYQTICAVLNAFVGFSSAAYVSNAMVEPEAAPAITSALLITAAMTMPLIFIMAWLFNANGDGYPAVIVVAMALTGLLTYILSCLQSYSILIRRYDYLFSLAILQLLPQAGLVLYFIFGSGITLGKLVAGNLLGLVVVALYGLAWLRVRFGWFYVRPDRRLLKKVVVYGLPLIPHLLLSLAIGSFDRWFLTNTFNMQLLAVYAVALSVSAPIYVMLDLANKVYAPLIFDRLRSGDRAAGRLGWPVVWLNAYSLLCAGVTGVLGGLFIEFFFDASYAEAAQYCLPLSGAIGAFSLYYSAAPFLYFFNRTRSILVVSSIGAAVTGVTTLWLFPTQGGFGLILGKFLGFAISGVVALAFAARIVRFHARER